MGWFRSKPRVVAHDYSFDEDPVPRSITCPDCGETHEGMTGFVLDHGDAYAFYYADWYPHQSQMIVELGLGRFHDPDDYGDNVLFGIRYGHVDGEPDAVASLRTPTHGAGVMGARPLTREEALVHPRLKDLWDVSDWLIENDPLLHREVFHMPSREA